MSGLLNTVADKLGYEPKSQETLNEEKRQQELQADEPQIRDQKGPVTDTVGQKAQGASRPEEEPSAGGSYKGDPSKSTDPPKGSLDKKAEGTESTATEQKGSAVSASGGDAPGPGASGDKKDNTHVDMSEVKGSKGKNPSGEFDAAAPGAGEAAQNMPTKGAETGGSEK